MACRRGIPQTGPDAAARASRPQIRGTPYITPLLYITDGAGTVVVASQGGLPKHPQWYHNLRAHPDTHIQIGRDRHPVRAVTADAQQRARLWPMLVDAYADFDTYQAWAEREIPVVVLEPRPDAG